MAPATREITVKPKTPMPKGYAFLAKGNAYKTRHCRQRTHDAGKTLYVVEDNKRVAGIRVPKHIFMQVQAQAKDTLSTRRAATELRDATLIRKAETELDALFPRIPKAERSVVLRQAFKKHSRRVGRSGQTPMPRKVQLAVIAHIRHKHTNYDVLLRKGMNRDDARRAVVGKMQNVLRAWGAKGDYSWYFLDDLDGVGTF